jgi:thiol-disulfide isomerase/thioredoxin
MGSKSSPAKAPHPWRRATTNAINGTDDFEDQVLHANVDENPDLARRYDVSSIPCLVIFRDGREFRRIVGLTPKGRIAEALDTAAAAA